MLYINEIIQYITFWELTFSFIKILFKFTQERYKCIIKMCVCDLYYHHNFSYLLFLLFLKK